MHHDVMSVMAIAPVVEDCCTHHPHGANTAIGYDRVPWKPCVLSKRGSHPGSAGPRRSICMSERESERHSDDAEQWRDNNRLHRPSLGSGRGASKGRTTA